MLISFIDPYDYEETFKRIQTRAPSFNLLNSPDLYDISFRQTNIQSVRANCEILLTGSFLAGWKIHLKNSSRQKFHHVSRTTTGPNMKNFDFSPCACIFDLFLSLSEPFPLNLAWPSCHIWKSRQDLGP